jgi:hypothetical protein
VDPLNQKRSRRVHWDRSRSTRYMLGGVYVMTHPDDLAAGIEGPEVQFL